MKQRNKNLVKIIFISIIVLFFILTIYCLFKQNNIHDREIYQPNLKAKDLVMEIPETSTSGVIAIYDENEIVFSYMGEIDIVNDGTNGEDINIVVDINKNIRNGGEYGE